MTSRIKFACAALFLTACDVPEVQEVQERMGVLHPCDVGEGCDESTGSGEGDTDGNPGTVGDGASAGTDAGEADDTSPMPDVIEGDPVQGCWGETIPWYQSYSLMLPVESCHYPSPDGAVPWVGTAGKTYLFYNNSAARIGYRNFKVVDCSPGMGNRATITVQYSQFYSTNDAHCENGLGDDNAFVDRSGSSAITSLTPLIGD